MPCKRSSETSKGINQRATHTSYTKSDDLPVLCPESVESISLFREALTHKLRSTFGRYACFMTTGDAYQPVFPPRPVSRPEIIRIEQIRLNQSASFPVIPDGVLIFDDDDVTDLCRREQMRRYYDKHSKSLILKKEFLSEPDESVQKLSDDKDYRATFDKQNPYTLLQVIHCTHNKSNSGWIVTDKVKATMQIPEWSIQRPSERD